MTQVVLTSFTTNGEMDRQVKERAAETMQRKFGEAIERHLASDAVEASAKFQKYSRYLTAQ
jgi:excisionase family DNA binding protein